jgi:hypothetical protein
LIGPLRFPVPAPGALPPAGGFPVPAPGSSAFSDLRTTMPHGDASGPAGRPLLRARSDELDRAIAALDTALARCFDQVCDSLAACPS